VREDPFGTLSRSVTEVLASGLTALDLVLLAVAAVVVLGGLRTGLIARVAAWAGVVLGFVFSGRTVPWVLALADGAGLPARTFIAVLTLSLTVSLTSAGLQIVTAPLRRILTIGPLSLIDRALGALASLVMFALLTWLLLPTAAAVPGRISSEVRASAVLGALDAATPPQPDVARTLRTLLGGERFPDVFASLAPTPEPSAPPEAIGIDPVVLARAIGATTGVRVVGCGRTYSGSGFAVDTELVVTNAHVVAGAREVTLRTHDGRRVEATVVVLDADRDLALLHAPGHGLATLALARAEVGAVGAVIGYPGGQDEPRVAPARIDRLVNGVGRDIYGRGATERSLYFLSARLRSGDSGAPLVDGSGRLVGVVFAVSPDVPTAAYALATTELESVLVAPRSPGDTGRCI
jgi:S1-C subfamily serine protease